MYGSVLPLASMPVASEITEFSHSVLSSAINEYYGRSKETTTVFDCVRRMSLRVFLSKLDSFWSFSGFLGGGRTRD